jgi:hypothetical protein
LFSANAHFHYKGMIQRIQTLYLFIALILMDIVMIFPMAIIVFGQEEALFYIAGLKPVPPAINSPAGALPLTILLFTNLLLIVAAILLYKRLKLQMRITIVNTALLLLTELVIVVYLFRFISLPGAGTHTFSLPIVFPLISAILLYLAYRGMKHDKELLDSLNRIR